MNPGINPQWEYMGISQARDQQDWRKMIFLMIDQKFNVPRRMTSLNSKFKVSGVGEDIYTFKETWIL